MVAGTWMIGGVSFSETLATARGVPFVMGVAQGIRDLATTECGTTPTAACSTTGPSRSPPRR